jgi:penicillin-binding protein 2
MVNRFQEDDRSPAGKIVFLQYTIALVFLVLLAGYWRLQIQQHLMYQDQAERNRIRNLPVIAPRGRILDREGRVLVDNFPAFTVLLMRDNTTPLTPEQVEGIARGMRLDATELAHLIERSAKLPRFQPVVLKQSATFEDIAFVESHRLEYPEIDMIQVQQRLYPKHEVAASVLGYVGEVSEEEIAQPGSPYRAGDVIGKSGIESSYNPLLGGRDGMRRVVVNSRGREVGSLTTIGALPGNDLRLTLDLDLQMAAEATLADQTGAIVALDPRSGEVLALVSHPAFDPNDFAHHIDREVWGRLTTDPLKPLMNKVIQAQLAPGSVFKIITGAAALETGTIDPAHTISCPGAITLYGHTYHDWKKGHGTVDFHRAIVISCDVYFYTLGQMLGIDKIAYFAKALGLGARTGIDLPSEDSGVIPSPEWAQKTFKRKWWAGETISVAIGQGAVAVTPLQLAYAIGGITTGGVYHRPHVAFQDQLLALGMDPPEENEKRFPLTASTVDALSKGMWGVVNEGGTGAGARCPGIEISGKTGTAQVVSASLEKSARNGDFKSNAWFVGYAPPTDPEIVVSVLVMQGEHSSVAAPIAREVIKAYYEKRPSQKPATDPRQAQARLMSRVERPLAPPPDKPVGGQ